MKPHPCFIETLYSVHSKQEQSSLWKLQSSDSHSPLEDENHRSTRPVYALDEARLSSLFHLRIEHMDLGTTLFKVSRPFFQWSKTRMTTVQIHRGLKPEQAQWALMLALAYLSVHHGRYHLPELVMRQGQRPHETSWHSSPCSYSQLYRWALDLFIPLGWVDQRYRQSQSSSLVDFWPVFSSCLQTLQFPRHVIEQRFLDFKALQHRLSSSSWHVRSSTDSTFNDSPWMDAAVISLDIGLAALSPFVFS